MIRLPYADGWPQRKQVPSRSGASDRDAARRGGGVGLDLVLALGAAAVEHPRPAGRHLRRRSRPRCRPSAVCSSRNSVGPP